jgi:hypothetical protein
LKQAGKIVEPNHLVPLYVNRRQGSPSLAREDRDRAALRTDDVR